MGTFIILNKIKNKELQIILLKSFYPIQINFDENLYVTYVLMENLSSYGELTFLWSTYLLMENLPSYGALTFLWRTYFLMENLPTYGGLTFLWSTYLLI